MDEWRSSFHSFKEYLKLDLHSYLAFLHHFGYLCHCWWFCNSLAGFLVSDSGWTSSVSCSCLFALWCFPCCSCLARDCDFCVLELMRCFCAFRLYLFGKCNDSIALWVIACIVDQVLLDNQVWLSAVLGLSKSRRSSLSCRGLAQTIRPIG